jgi:DNA-binding MarR family transcriptional regulator
MGPELTDAILGLSRRMLMLKAMQEDEAAGAVGERELLILTLLKDKGTISVSEIADAVPNVSYSTISTDITRLWREKKMVNKTIDPQNQRVTLVSLTDAGAKAVQTVLEQRNERLRRLYDAMDTTKEEEQVIIRVSHRAIEYFDKFLGLNGQKAGHRQL